MTAADHANTGVDIIAVAKKFAPEVVYLRLVELEKERDALQTQAEDYELLAEDHDTAEQRVTAMEKRAETAEAERDQMRAALARMDTAYQEVELIGHQMTTRALAAESERDLALQAASDFRAERDAVVREARKLQAKYDDIRGEYLVLEDERDAAIREREAERDQALKDAADYLNHLHRAEAERDHARDALRKILGHRRDNALSCLRDVQEIARAALGEAQ